MQLQVCDARCRRRRARARRRRGPRRGSRRTAAAPGGAGTGAPKRREHRGDGLALGALGRQRPRRVGRPISAFSASGVPSATMRPWSMIPTRSASTSASSRYCVVRKTVTPVVAREPGDLLPQVGAAGRVEAGRRLVEEQQPRPVHERQREVEPPLHAARVAADLAVGGVGQADALEQLVAARAPLAPSGRPAAWSAAACARGRSAAGRAPPPAARRRSRRARAAPSRTMS